MTQTINRTQFRNAAIAACRVAYKAVHGADFDTDCPAKEKWIREEEDALEPALEALGISVEPIPAPRPARVKDFAEAGTRKRFNHAHIRF